ncbi:MAG: 23S rRNA (cytidine(2498)-2'-O)-methyltransferase RlmM, partial [Rhodocyclaceae bacterium]|nr:23S rRNA (cytidine(2498)-2'-O)-methyltransferase RlmM [Rhodocyclaceae bacterium]
MPDQDAAPAHALLLYCRPGFEGECAREISSLAAEFGVWGHVRAKPDSGYLSFHPNDAAGGLTMRSRLRFADLVFPRQVIHRALRVDGLPVTDRAAPIADAAATLGENFSAVWIETADTNEAKELSSFCRRFAGPLDK